MEQKKRIRVGTIIGIIAALGVITALFFGYFAQRLGVFGAHATPAASGNPTRPMPTPAAGYATFRSADGLFGVNVATSWRQQSVTQNANAVYTFSAPTTLEFARITEEHQSFAPNNLDSYLQSAAAGENGTGYVANEAAHSYPVGVNRWWRAQGTFTIAGVPQRIIGFAMTYQGGGILMIYTAPSPDYHVLVGSPFTEMVTTFTYLR